MDFMPGERLDLVWPNMTADEKDGICRQLREFSTRCDPFHGPTASLDLAPAGQCEIAVNMMTILVAHSPDEASFNLFYFDLVGTIPDPIREALRQQLRDDHRIVFSHGDLAQHNILVENGQITGLLDWEYAGWYRALGLHQVL